MKFKFNNLIKIIFQYFGTITLTPGLFKQPERADEYQSTKSEAK